MFNHIDNIFSKIKYLILKHKLVALVIFMMFFESITVQASNIAGVDPDSKQAITYQAQAAIGYERAADNAMLEMPSSVAAVTCFDQAATAVADVSGEIFSGKISKQANDTISNDLASHYENFSWDNLLSYEPSLNLEAEFEVSFSIGLGSDSGPTVKNMECDSLGTLWEAKKEKAGGAFPTLAEAMAKGTELEETETSQNQARYSNDNGTAETPGNKFILEWSSSNNDGLTAVEGLNGISNNIKARYRGMDRDFSEEDDPCRLLRSMSGSSFNCDDIK